MPVNNDGSVTPLENPDDVELAGSEPSDEAPVVRSDEPDAAYKGLQRRLSAKDREIADLTRQVEEKSRPTGTPFTPEAQAAIIATLQELAKHDPTAANVMAQNIRQQNLEAQNRQLENQSKAREDTERSRANDARNTSELRDLAADLGANPDSSLIDYGDSSMDLSERMRLVRETAKAAAKPAAVTTERPTTSNGQQHNAQPGVTAPAKAAPKSYTQEDYRSALSVYRKTPTAANLKKADDIRAAMQAAA